MPWTADNDEDQSTVGGAGGAAARRNHAIKGGRKTLTREICFIPTMWWSVVIMTSTRVRVGHIESVSSHLFKSFDVF